MFNNPALAVGWKHQSFDDICECIYYTIQLIVTNWWVTLTLLISTKSLVFWVQTKGLVNVDLTAAIGCGDPPNLHIALPMCWNQTFPIFLSMWLYVRIPNKSNSSYATAGHESKLSIVALWMCGCKTLVFLLFPKDRGPETSVKIGFNNTLWFGRSRYYCRLFNPGTKYWTKWSKTFLLNSGPQGLRVSHCPQAHPAPAAPATPAAPAQPAPTKPEEGVPPMPSMKRDPNPYLTWSPNGPTIAPLHIRETWIDCVGDPTASSWEVMA